MRIDMTNHTPLTSESPTVSGELRVLILGPLRLQLKVDEFHMPFPDDGSQSTFWKSMLELFPELPNSWNSVRLARNSQFLTPEESLKPGDEVALIPPVSGG
jgi:molybdopterin converting factor small subunit